MTIFMTRFLLKLSLVLVVAFAAFNAAARALGTLQPPNPALVGFTEGCEGKPQPCWYGIVPGVTTAEEANQIAQKQQFRQVVSGAYPLAFEPASNSGLIFIGLNYDLSQIVKGIILYFDERIRLGNVLSVTGSPDKIYIFDMLRKTKLVHHYSNSYIHIDPDGGIDRLSLYRSGVNHLTLSTTTHTRSITVLPWEGFKRPSYYCRLNPALAFCN